MMDEESGIDLSGLVPVAPDDQAKPAVRRFRMKAVAAAVAIVLLVLGAVGGVSAWAISKVADRQKLTEDAYRFVTDPQSLTQADYLNNCSTPTYEVGGSELILLGVAQTRPPQVPSQWPEREGPATGWVFHFAIKPLTTPDTNMVDSLDGTGRVASLDETKLTPIDPPGTAGLLYSLPGWTWAQLYPSIPWPKDGDITMQLEYADGQAHEFHMDLDQILCENDPSTGKYIRPT
jgi:hypothetical protein